MKYENLQVEYSDIPQYDEVKINALEPNFFKVIIIENIISNLVVTALFAVGLYFGAKTFFTENVLWLLPLIFVLLFTSSIIIEKIAFKNRGYAVRQHDILYKKGFYFKKTTVVPFRKIQHCAVIEGFISRFFGLAGIKLYTAAQSGFDLHIKGLTKENADRLKDFIMAQINTNEKLS